MIKKVFVDLDNTLLPFDTVIPVWREILKGGLIPKVSRISLRFGTQSLPKSLMVSCFAGISMKEYNKFFLTIAQQFVYKIDFAVKNWAEDLVKDKNEIHIVTGSLSSLANAISEMLGWGQSVGTEVETKDGALTGRLNSPAVKGSQKVDAIRNVLRFENDEFYFCAAAGDSYGDRHLLQKCSLQYFPKKTSDRLKKYFNKK